MLRKTERREFLRKIALGSIGITWMPQLIASPYESILDNYQPANPIRISGVVKERGRAVNGVVISDGLNVVSTKSDGTFELISSSERPFVWMSMPSGYDIPTGSQGVANFYKPVIPQNRSMEIQWDLEKLKSNDDKHAFLVMADPQTLDMDDIGRFQQETIPDAKSIISNSEVPYFNLACGDIMYDRLELYEGYKEGISELDIPSFQVIGNHDLDFGPTDEGSIVTFMSHFGPGYYSFNRGEIHYVVLDDVFWFGDGYMGYIDEVQYKWLENDLSFVEKGKKVVVLTHIPVFDQQFIRNNQAKPRNSVVVTNRDRLYQILESYDAHIITGHMHTNNSFKDGGVTHHNCGAVCGAWWTGDICTDGTPNGYAVYEANGSSLDWNYKSTGLPIEHQIRLHQPGSDPKAPDELVANIWDVREDSEVYWLEDGIRKGKMARRVGQDPLSVRNHLGSEKPAKHKWVEPGNTGHLFYAPILKDTKEVVVEVKNLGGKAFTEKLKQ